MGPRRLPAVLATLAICTACVNPILAPTSAANLAIKSEIKIRNINLYNAKYTGTLEECFPPPGRKIDPNPLGKSIYEPTKPLNAKIVDISISDRSPWPRKEIKEMAILLSAYVCNRLKFAKFTHIKTTTSYSGSTYYSVESRGTRVGNTYTGSSQLRENYISASLHVFQILLFNDQQDLDNGVFTQSSLGGDMVKFILPYRELYRGTTPFDADEARISKAAFEPPTGSGIFIDIQPNAWKTHYLPDNVIAELQTLHPVSFNDGFKILDEKERDARQKEKRASEPLEKLKVKQ